MTLLSWNITMYGTVTDPLAGKPAGMICFISCNSSK